MNIITFIEANKSLKKSSSLVVILFLMCGLAPFDSVAKAPQKKQNLEVLDVSAPHPKHCLDERQWRGFRGHTPFNLFDGDPKSLWQPCSYALADEGYTVNIDLKTPIEFDGLEIIQASKGSLINSEVGERTRTSKKGETPPSIHRFEHLQLLFFNHDISVKYPIYFQEIQFDGDDRIKIKYDGALKWNPRLLGDSMFDERRRALKLSPKGISPPLKTHKIGIVFPRFDSSQPPPALAELKFYLRGVEIKVTNLAQREREYSEVMSKVYELMVKDFMFIGERRAMIFSHTGTIWAMEDEEEEAKVIGGWRFNQDRLEYDISSRQRQRVSAKRRAKIERAREQYYQPLSLILDEAPDRVFIKTGELQGEYQTVKAPSKMSPVQGDGVESPPSFDL